MHWRSLRRKLKKENLNFTWRTLILIEKYLRRKQELIKLDLETEEIQRRLDFEYVNSMFYDTDETISDLSD